MKLTKLLLILSAVALFSVACGNSADTAEPVAAETAAEDVTVSEDTAEVAEAEAEPTATLEPPTDEPAPTATPAEELMAESNRTEFESTVIIPPELADLVEVQLNFGNDHVAVGEPVEYDVYPPTSGTHWGQWAQPGVYSEPVPAEAYVHSLEHGYVVLLYNCGDNCEKSQEELVAFARSLPVSEKYGYPKIVISADPKIETTYAVLAWQHYMPLDTFDEDLILSFYNATMDNGPEDAG